MATLSEEQKSYLLTGLQMNPVWQSGEILVARSEQFGIKSQDARNEAYRLAQDYANAKATLSLALQEIRDVIWTAPVDELRKRLAEIELGSFPELKEQANRLDVIAESRTKLDGLTTHKDFNQEFFDCIKQVLTESPAAAAAVRERVLVSFEMSSLRASGRRCINLLQNEVPQFCGLESKWFDSLVKIKRKFFAREASSSISGWTVFWVLFVIVKVIVLASNFSK